MLISKDETSHSFLILQYKEIDFVINRNQLSASTSLNKITKIKSSLPYLDSYSWYKEKRLLLINFHSYIQDLYKCKGLGNSQLCLIIKLEKFTNKGQQVLKKLLSNNNRFAQEYIGVIISSQAEIHDLTLKEIHLNPSGLNSVLSKNGLYGCRFPQEDRIQYFVDLQINILNTLTRGTHANSPR